MAQGRRRPPRRRRRARRSASRRAGRSASAATSTGSGPASMPVLLRDRRHLERDGRLGVRAARVPLGAVAADLLAGGEHELDRVRRRPQPRGELEQPGDRRPCRRSRRRRRTRRRRPAAPAACGRRSARPASPGRTPASASARGVELRLDPCVAPAHAGLGLLALLVGLVGHVPRAEREHAGDGGVAAEHVDRPLAPDPREGAAELAHGELPLGRSTRFTSAPISSLCASTDRRGPGSRPSMRSTMLPGAVPGRAAVLGQAPQQVVVDRRLDPARRVQADEVGQRAEQPPRVSRRASRRPAYTGPRVHIRRAPCRYWKRMPFRPQVLPRPPGRRLPHRGSSWPAPAASAAAPRRCDRAALHRRRRPAPRLPPRRVPGPSRSPT